MHVFVLLTVSMFFNCAWIIYEKLLSSRGVEKQTANNPTCTPSIHFAVYKKAVKCTLFSDISRSVLSYMIVG